MRLLALLLCAGLLSIPMSLKCQTTLNPDISLIGDMRSYVHDDPDRPTEQQKLKLADPAMELYITGYLNPYVKASATVGWHTGDDAVIEEVYATVLRGLPLRSSITAGKHLLPFGRLNPVHEHAWSFIERPLPHVLFLGEEGLNDVAVRIGFNPATGSAFTELSGALLKGDALFGHAHEHEGEEDHDEEEETDPDLGVFSRLTTSFAVSEYGELALGASVVNAVSAIHRENPAEAPMQLRTTVAGVDIKYKNKPSRYKTLQIEGEAMLRRDETEDGGHLTSYGGYGYVDYRFRQIYNIGGIFESVKVKEQHEEAGSGPEIHEMTIWRAGLFLGFSPVEETSVVRLAGHWTEPDEGNSFWEVTIQLVFSLGPHQPHNF